MPFTLDARLEADSLFVADLALSQLRLMNNRRFPWLVLIPRRKDLREITDLPLPEQHLLLDEITHASTTLQSLTSAHKMNIGALGNIVSQLHIHVIARFPEDSAWPAPVWGTGGEAYPPAEAETLLKRLQNAFEAK